jgi:hypothetical protein
MVGNTKESSKERAGPKPLITGSNARRRGTSYLLPGVVERLDEESCVPLEPPGVRPMLPLEPDELEPPEAVEPPDEPPAPS